MSASVISFLAVSLIPIVRPGPASLLMMSNTVNFGIKSGLSSTVGNAVAVTIVGSLLRVGLGKVFIHFPSALAALQLTSALYLLYLGCTIIREDWKRLVRAGKKKSTNGARIEAFRSSLLLGFTNPTTIMFFTSVMPLFLSTETSFSSEASILVISYVVASTAYHICLTVLAAAARVHIQGIRTVIAIRKSTGVLFTMLSLLLGANPIQALGNGVPDRLHALFLRQTERVASYTKGRYCVGANAIFTEVLAPRFSGC